MWESPTTAVEWLKSKGFTRTAASVEFAKCQFPRFETEQLGLNEMEGHVRYVALVLQLLNVLRPEIITRPVLADVRLFQGFSTSNLIYLTNNVILPKVKNKSADFLIRQIILIEQELAAPATHSVDSFFRHHRNRTAEILSKRSSLEAVNEFDHEFRSNQENMSKHPRTKLEIEKSDVIAKNLTNDPVVFMGLKAVPEHVMKSILVNGLVPLKYLNNRSIMRKAGTTLTLQNDRQANYLRRRFILDLPRTSAGNLNVYKLLQMANAHKSGPGVTTSGFHSTSGKPGYAAQYSQGSASSSPLRVSYNMCLGIRVTDKSFPLIIQDGIENWNRYHSEKKIVMAFSKESKNWKHDYESEILLGGATPASDFVYIGLAKVTAVLGMGMKIRGKKVKTKKMRHKDLPPMVSLYD